MAFLPLCGTKLQFRPKEGQFAIDANRPKEGQFAIDGNFRDKHSI